MRKLYKRNLELEQKLIASGSTSSNSTLALLGGRIGENMVVNDNGRGGPVNGTQYHHHLTRPSPPDFDSATRTELKAWSQEQELLIRRLSASLSHATEQVGWGERW